MSDPTEPGPSGGQPPPQYSAPQYGAPQYGAPPPYQQPYAAPSRNPGQTIDLIAGIVIIAGCVAAGAGLLAGFLAFATDEYSTALKFQEFLYAVSLGVGLGAIAVASGYLLRIRAKEMSQP